MTKSALKGRADDPRACRGVIRATLFTLPLVVFVSLALVPMNANISNSGVCVHRCEAFADVTPTEYGYQFLQVLAGDAGLSVNDTVATVTGITAGATGLVLSNSTGIVLGASGNNALDNLLDAADYPDWDTLDATQQASWVNQSNYNAAKFNSLMNAYGLDQARDRFYSSSGNFEWTENELDNVKRLGRIGNNWKHRIGVSINDLVSCITDRESLNDWFPSALNENLEFDGSNVSDWPWPNYPVVNYSPNVTQCGVIYNNGGAERVVEAEYPVYVVCWSNPTSGTTSMVTFQLFSKQPFTYESNTTWSKSRFRYTADYREYNGQGYYTGQDNNPLSNIVQYKGVTPNFDSAPSISNRYIPIILYGDQGSSGGSEVVEVPDYPEEVPDSDFIYFPPDGITPSTPWNVYIEVQRPDNEYNPDNQTGNPEWKQETKQNVMPLQNIKFDKLFPFCLMTDVKDLTEKIEDTITPGEQSNYLTIRIPMAYASSGEDVSSEDIELDCTPVRDVLVMVRPFNQVLLLFFMVFSLVMFWKSILTGD